MEYARGGTAGGEPDIRCSADCYAAAAGREGRLVCNGGRDVLIRDLFPGDAAIRRANDKKAAVHRITERNAVALIPKGEPIKEGLRVTVDELSDPGASTVGRFIDS